ncbi:MAG: serine hydrolase domain-containing protein [Bacteroidota bacterium]
MRAYLSLLLLVIATSLFAQQKPDFSTYTEFLETEIAEDHIAGAVSLIVRDGKVLHEGAWGFANREKKEAMAPDQIFHLMSMTKPIVSLAFMMLHEEGKFQLEDPVSKYLEGFDELQVATSLKKGKDVATVPAKTPITIRQVLTHTAGFSHGLSGSPLDNDIARALYYSPQENIESRVMTLRQLPLHFQPGTRWFYSASPDILALLIEHFSGMTAADFLQKRIFTPLNMADTGYNLPEDKAAKMAKLYKVEDGKLVRDPMQMGATGNKVYGGTHGLLSTAADYGKFCQMLLDGGKAPDGTPLVKEATLALMTRNHLGDIPYRAGQGFGLGFGLDTEVPEDGLGAAGRYYWSGAYSTFFFVDPENDLYAILMTQLAPFTGSYGDALRKYVYQGL